MKMPRHSEGFDQAGRSGEGSGLMFRFASPWLLLLALPVLGAAWTMARRRRLADARLTLETFRHYIGRLMPRAIPDEAEEVELGASREAGEL